MKRLKIPTTIVFLLAASAPSVHGLPAAGDLHPLHDIEARSLDSSYHAHDPVMRRAVMDIVMEGAPAKCNDGLFIAKPDSGHHPPNVIPFSSQELKPKALRGRDIIVPLLLADVDEMDVLVQKMLKDKAQHQQPASEDATHGRRAVVPDDAGGDRLMSRAPPGEGSSKRPASEQGGRSQGKQPMKDSGDEQSQHQGPAAKFEDPEGLQWQRSGLTPRGGAQKLWTDSVYKPTDLNGVNFIKAVEDALSELYVGNDKEHESSRPWEKLRPVSTTVYRDKYLTGAHLGFAWKQAKPWSVNKNTKGKPTSEGPATNAEYLSVYNIIDGVLLAQVAKGPCNSMADKTSVPPALHRWSDVAWVQWRKLHDQQYLQGARGSPSPNGFSLDTAVKGLKLDNGIIERSMKGWLNYIMVAGNGQKDETLRVIASCMHNQGLKPSDKVAWKERRTFPLGHWCFYSLLATENSAGVVDFLAEHKGTEGLGTKAFQSVTIFWTVESHWPTLLWEVVDSSTINVNVKKFWDEMWIKHADFVNDKDYSHKEQIGGPPEGPGSHPGPAAPAGPS